MVATIMSSINSLIWPLQKPSWRMLTDQIQPSSTHDHGYCVRHGTATPFLTSPQKEDPKGRWWPDLCEEDRSVWYKV